MFGARRIARAIPRIFFVARRDAVPELQHRLCNPGANSHDVEREWRRLRLCGTARFSRYLGQNCVRRLGRSRNRRGRAVSVLLRPRRARASSWYDGFPPYRGSRRRTDQRTLLRESHGQVASGWWFRSLALRTRLTRSNEFSGESAHLRCDRSVCQQHKQLQRPRAHVVLVSGLVRSRLNAHSIACVE
jgi:hypothetical protein